MTRCLSASFVVFVVVSLSAAAFRSTEPPLYCHGKLTAYIPGPPTIVCVNACPASSPGSCVVRETEYQGVTSYFQCSCPSTAGGGVVVYGECQAIIIEFPNHDLDEPGTIWLQQCTGGPCNGGICTSPYPPYGPQNIHCCP